LLRQHRDIQYVQRILAPVKVDAAHGDFIDTNNVMIGARPLRGVMLLLR